MKKPPPPESLLARLRHDRLHGRQLSKEDKDLWESTAASLKPLSRAKSRVRAKAASVAEVHAPVSRAVETKISLDNLEALFTAKGRQDAGAGVSKAPGRPAAALNTFDRKAARRLKIGKSEIEARIDLHGMRQHEAHAALRRFLKSCHAQGRRYVLVITGKGGPARRDPDQEFEMTGREERGVLKRNVPMWLAEPELSAIVVSSGKAAPQHGGDGALYIHLRSRERSER